MNGGDGAELGGLFVGVGFVGHAAAADFGAGEKLHGVGIAERRMKFDVEGESGSPYGKT